MVFTLNELLHMCVYSMVEKDPAKRPSVNEALRFPVVLHQIEVCFYAVLCKCRKITTVFWKKKNDAASSCTVAFESWVLLTYGILFQHTGKFGWILFRCCHCII